jgi:AraC-like DNA-binding protein
MPFRTLSAETIADWERAVGPTPIHGVELQLVERGTVERHCHSRGQIMLVIAGVITVETAQESWVVSGPRALWIPERTPHSVSASINAELRNLQVSRVLAPQLPFATCMLAVTPLFKELVVSAVAGPNEINVGGREAKIIELMVDEFTPTRDLALHLPEPEDIRLKRICSKLRSEPGDVRTLDEWSELAGGCTRTLGRLFVRETGMTFAQWRRQARLLDAIVRLNAGQSVTSVALDAGYESPSAFIEMFRRTMGTTPGQYLETRH